MLWPTRDQTMALIQASWTSVIQTDIRAFAVFTHVSFGTLMRLGVVPTSALDPLRPLRKAQIEGSRKSRASRVHRNKSPAELSAPCASDSLPNI